MGGGSPEALHVRVRFCPTSMSALLDGFKVIFGGTEERHTVNTKKKKKYKCSPENDREVIVGTIRRLETISRGSMDAR